MSVGPTELPRPLRLRALVFASLLLVACGGGEGSEAIRVADGTPIVLVSVDTLRSDRLPAYGYEGVDTPALDSLRRDSILFEHTFSPVPMTLPAHATMLSGLTPDAHGVRDNLGYRLAAEEFPWLPRILQHRGYATGAAVSSFVVRSDTGLGHGFDFYEDRIRSLHPARLGGVQRRGGETLGRTVDWLRSVSGEPFFLFFHLYEPHRPFDAPEPFASRYPSAYDAEIAAADAVVGELIEELRSLGVYERSLLILTSDHGEGLGDHGLDEHGPLLYREQIQVPLLLKLPGFERANTAVAAPAQLMDLPPTLLQLLGLDVPEELSGRSLLTLAPVDDEPPRPIFSETLFPRLHFGWSELLSVIRWPYHYIHGPDPELYHLVEDPTETENLLRVKRGVYAELRDILDEGYDGSYRPPGAAVDPETRSKLAALGYVGSVAGEREGPLPDPKSRLHVLEELNVAMDRFQARDLATATERFRGIVEEEPAMVEGWLYLGHSLLGLGRDREALRAYEHLVELTEGAPYATLAAASPLLRLGRLEEAEAHARPALRQHPMEAHELLARIALETGELEEAERHAAEAIAHRDARIDPLVTGARVALARGKAERALALAEEALTELPDGSDPTLLRGLHFVRGQAHARLGDADQARRAFLEEIRLFPQHLSPYSHLALLHALSGNADRAGAVLRQMLETNPTPSAHAEAVETLRVLGDPASARRLLERARRRWPDSTRLRELAG